MRIKIIHGIIIFIFIFLALGIFNLQVRQGDKFRQLSDKNCIRLIPQEGSRGRILDRNGEVIAGNRLSYDVVILPRKGPEAEILLAQASEILGINIGEIKRTFKNNFINSSMPVIIARNIDAHKAIALEEAKFDLDSLVVQPRPLREYPYGKLACHVLGYLDEIDRWRLTKLQDYGYRQKDMVGFSGVEEKYDYYLRQDEGGLSVEVDHRGKLIRVLGFKPAQNGKDIQLTLDLKMQKIAEEAITGRKGAIVIMDPYTGAILALVSAPGFDPSLFIRKNNASLRGIFNDPDAPLVNRVISSAYPPGSVFKLVVASAGLEARKINLRASIACNGSMNIGKQIYNCLHIHGQQDLINAIANSCNIFFYKTGLFLGAQAIHDYALKFGFAKDTSLELPYEASGNVPSALWKKVSRLQKWFDGDTANFAIGQGDLLVTPLQVARMAAVFANKGKLVNPHIIQAIDGRNISISKNKTADIALKMSTINSVAQGMQEAVLAPHGTASLLSGLAVSVAGKTGTAQVARKHSHGWFAGFLPVKEPKYAICVLVEHGGSGQVACLLAKQIIENMIQQGLI